MSSVSRLRMMAAGCCLMALSASGATLRVCSDPNNLPYSNEQRQGFENKIAELIAGDLGMQVDYFWFPQREKFFQRTLNSRVCDVVMGVPASGFEEAGATRPYYRSSYAFVSRRDRNLHIDSFDDPRLRTLKIGVQVLGDERDMLPPVHALVSRGVVKNLVAYSIFGNLNEKNPAEDVLRAVEDGGVDVAVVWGPLAGYFARSASVPLAITPVLKDPRNPELRFQFDIGLGVRADDEALKRTLDGELTRRRAEIEQILRTYGVPQIPLAVETARSTEE